MKNLEATVEARIKGKPCGTYTVSTFRKEGKAILRITPCEGTGGHWQWYLETLILDGPVSDELSLDFGQDWSVFGMFKVYEEIINRSV